MRNVRADLNDTPERDRSIRRPRRRFERRPGDVPSSVRKRTLPAVLLAVLLTVIAAGCTPGFSGGSGPVFPALSARGLPANPDSIELTVSAPDMVTVSRTIAPGDSSITLEVPAGAAREFNLTASNVSVTTSGSTVQDLTAGTSVEIALSLDLIDSKVIAPDYWGNRLVQIDDMTGTGWKEINYSTIGLLNQWEMRPREVHFDNSGRIYVVLDQFETALMVFRLDDIEDTTHETIVEDPISPQYGGIYKPLAAIDRNADTLFIPGEADIEPDETIEPLIVEFTLVDPPEQTTVYNLEHDIPPTGFFDPAAISVDSSGNVYLMVNNQGLFTIYALDLSQPEGSRVLASKEFSGGNARDMIVRNDEVLVSATYSVNVGSFIRRYDTELVQVGSDLPGKSDGTDDFIGVEHFLVVPDGGIIVIDEDLNDTINRIVSFEDFTTNGWSDFKAADIGKTEFKFFQFPN